MNDTSKLKNLYDLEHQRIVNSSNIWYIILATLLISFLFSNFPEGFDKDIVILLKINSVLVFLVLVVILSLIFNLKIREVEKKIEEL